MAPHALEDAGAWAKTPSPAGHRRGLLDHSTVRCSPLSLCCFSRHASGAGVPIAQAAGSPQTKVALYNIFVGRVRAHLHLCICMSPLGETFRTRLRNFPSLVNNCTIDYFAEWPEEALRSVATNTLDTIDMGQV